MAGDLISRHAAIALVNSRAGAALAPASVSDAGEGFDLACEEIAAALGDMPAAETTVRQAALVLLNAHLDMPVSAKLAAVRAHVEVSGKARPVAVIRAWRDALWAIAYPEAEGE